jgi:hypothetical protein
MISKTNPKQERLINRRVGKASSQGAPKAPAITSVQGEKRFDKKYFYSNATLLHRFSGAIQFVHLWRVKDGWNSVILLRNRSKPRDHSYHSRTVWPRRRRRAMVATMQMSMRHCHRTRFQTARPVFP